MCINIYNNNTMTKEIIEKLATAESSLTSTTLVTLYIDASKAL